jgi:coproporphyrinogen III oxidase-like Fe-S oxidoreductase
VIACAPDHISAYALTIEDGTPLAIEVARGRVPDVDPDLQADRHGIADEMLTAAGYRRYEVSNWARPQRASRHNVLYWSAGDYAGFGAGAHGHLGGRRWWNARLPREFVTRVAKGAGTESGHELLGPSERVREAMVLGLRLTSGVDMDGFRRRFGPTVTEELTPAIAELVDRGLLHVSGARVALAAAATLVANEVFCRVL